MSQFRASVFLQNMAIYPWQYGDAFYLYTDSRYRLILSGKYVDMLRNEKRLDFITALADVSKMSIWRNQKLTRK